MIAELIIAGVIIMIFWGLPTMYTEYNEYKATKNRNEK